MNTVRLIFCFVVSITLVGCAAMNKEECQTASWYDVGLEDGSAGREMDSLGRYREACAKHGVTADAAEYNRGYNEGVINFCTPQRGYNLGRNGRQYNGICPAPLDKPFVNAYQQGQGIYNQELVVENYKQQVSTNEERIGELAVQISETESALLLPEQTPEARKETLNKLLNLQQEKTQAEANLRVALSQQVDAELELARLLANAPY